MPILRNVSADQAIQLNRGEHGALSPVPDYDANGVPVPSKVDVSPATYTYVLAPGRSCEVERLRAPEDKSKAPSRLEQFIAAGHVVDVAYSRDDIATADAKALEAMCKKLKIKCYPYEDARRDALLHKLHGVPLPEVTVGEG